MVPPVHRIVLRVAASEISEGRKRFAEYRRVERCEWNAVGPGVVSWRARVVCKIGRGSAQEGIQCCFVYRRATEQGATQGSGGL